MLPPPADLVEPSLFSTSHLCSRRATSLEFVFSLGREHKRRTSAVRAFETYGVRREVKRGGSVLGLLSKVQGLLSKVQGLRISPGAWQGLLSGHCRQDSTLEPFLQHILYQLDLFLACSL